MYKLKMLLIFILLILVCSHAHAFIKEAPLINKVIYLDAGHGGKDPGAYYKDIYEKDINLKIVLKLKDKLESLGAIVYLTRDNDYDLSEKGVSRRKKSDLGNRAKIINDSNADIYLSIHLNSSIHTSWNGIQVFYDDINAENKKIAEIFQKKFNKYLNDDKKTKEISTLYMYKNINIPGVLLELGFISNPNDRYLLIKDDYQNKMIDIISKSLIAILI